MSKRLINIISLFLLLIFPISAVGLDLSIYKCKHNGSLDIALFTQNTAEHAKSCACSHEHSAKKIETQKPEIKEEARDCCSKKAVVKPIVKIVKKAVKSHSCCSKEKESKSESEIPSNPINEKKESVKNVVNSAPCCTNSNIYFVVNTTSIPTTIKDEILKIQNISPQIRIDLNIDTKLFNKDTYKEVPYPKKEPISRLITFIHFKSSSLNGEDSPAIS